MATMQSLKAASDKHVEQRRAILTQLLRLILGLWSDFDRWDDEQVVKGMAARTAMLASSAISKTRRAQRSYLASVLADFGVDTRALPTVIESYPRANTFPLEVYQRPADQYVWRRRNGGSLIESQEDFEKRLRAIAQADMAAAEREEAQRIYESIPQVIGHRRIIHPERAKSGFSCGLCVVAATQFYSTNELMPLHDGCNCDSAPVTKASDPGLALNKDDLREIYAAAGDSSAGSLLNTRVKVREHGELGQILVKKGDHFRTPEEAGRPPWAPSTPATRRAAAQAQLVDLRSAIAESETRLAGLSDEDGGPRLALVRSVKYMRELAAATELLLTRE